MIVLEYIFYVIQVITVFFLLFPFLNVIASLLIPGKKIREKITKQYDFAAVITAYKETEICIPLVESLLKQDYENYIVYLVADECDISVLNFDSEKVLVLKPEKKLGSKVKSIKYAIDNFKRKHEVVTIFDPDNLAHPDFMKITNKYFNNGFSAVQCRRTAKNVNTIYACIDAMGEYYYNYIVRLAPFKLGSSAPIAGSGMTIEYNLYKENLENEEISAGIDKVIVAEDKILQAELVEKGYRIAFANDAIVFDEKVTSAAQVERQRTRWLNSYFMYAITALRIMFKGLFRLDWNQFYFGLNIFLPPLFIIILLSLLLTVVNLFISIPVFLSWVGALFIFNINFMLVLALSKVEKEIWKSLWGVPFFVFNQLMALFKIKRSKKEFMETKHEKYLTIDEVLKNKAVH